jgi:hypothetical protein
VDVDDHPAHPEYNGDDDTFEHQLRPQYLADFLGQDQIKANLAVFITAARERHESLDHVFLSGPPGLGKTTLATIMAREMQTDLRITAAPALEKPKDLAGILTTLQEGTVFFIDENSPSQELPRGDALRRHGGFRDRLGDRAGAFGPNPQGSPAAIYPRRRDHPPPEW